MAEQTQEITDKDIQLILNDKESAVAFKKRRIPDWTTNYTLYRDKVIVNRITQRQSINVPLMKYAISSIMKDIDDPPQLYFKNRSNDDQKELFMNAYWEEIYRNSMLDVRDWIDKKQVGLFGRSFKKYNLIDGIITIELVDPKDMLVDRYVDPADLNTARFVVQTGIFKPITEIINNDMYDLSVRKQIERDIAPDQGEQHDDNTFDAEMQPEQPLADMGLDDAYDPDSGESVMELNEVFRFEKDDDGSMRIMFYVIGTVGGRTYKLYKKWQQDHIGKTIDEYWDTHYIFNTWGSDPDRIDFWTDAPADIIRQINVAVNMYIAQLVENRQLRNFNMHYYNSSDDQFVPQTFIPEPWGWYPVGGNPNELIKDVMVSDLSESLDEIKFIIELGEKAVATTSAQTGTIESRQVTLGEVQLALQNAQDRVKAVEKFYKNSWLQVGYDIMKMIEATADRLEPIEISRKGLLTGQLYTKTIRPEDYVDKKGYLAEVKIKNDKDTEDVNKMQKLNLARSKMPMNQPLERIDQEFTLRFAGLSPEEIKAVMNYQQVINEAQMTMGNNDTMNQPQPSLPMPQMAQPGVQQ